MQNIYFKDRQNFENVLEKIKQDGLEKLYILSDFDRTLTKSFVNGKKKAGIISVLRNGDYLTPEYRQKAREMFDHYRPFELDVNISKKERNKKMLEWWSTHKEILIDVGLKKEDIKNAIQESEIRLREKIKSFLEFLSQQNIPLVIISASGIGYDAIGFFLEKEKLLTPNIYIISNKFFWDENSVAIGYDKKIIHSFNKHEQVPSDYPEMYEKVKTRKNVILLGDSLGDPDMIEGFEHDNLLKIGFLNEKEDESLEVYKEKYDVVLTGDGEGEFVDELLR
ncbi:hypothetical protein CSB09_04210 [Candidatus Gracilibacteria bacterium]|nr:MAG: hypothetical protein CSB09_04210 [Candidatus Gracilibacteria bacterium]